jgi:hypothetical protein
MQDGSKVGEYTQFADDQIEIKILCNFAIYTIPVDIAFLKSLFKH